MSEQTIIDNDYATLWYHPETKIIHHKIKKYIYGKKLQDLLSAGTEQLRKHGAKKWLSDDINNNALTAKDTEWTTNEWIPNTVKVGWKYWALVQPEKLTGQSNMKKHANLCADAGIIVQVFSNPDEAMKWLERQ